MDRLKKLLHRPLHRYIIIGGGVYLLEVAVIVGAQHFGANPVLAIGISFWVGLVVSFGLQKIITFSDRRMHHHVVIPQFLAYCALVIFNFSFTLAIARLLSGLMPAFFIRAFALGITTIWNFYLYKSRIFNIRRSEIL